MDTNKKIAALAAEKVLAKLGIKEGNTLKTVLPETVFEADAEREDWLELPQFTLEAGKKYKIVIDGGEYVAVAKDVEGTASCGNQGLCFDGYENTGGGWVINSDNGICDILFDSYNTAQLAHAIAIYEMVKLNEPIDELLTKAKSAVLHTPQELTEEQKAQARENIGSTTVKRDLSLLETYTITEENVGVAFYRDYTNDESIDRLCVYITVPANPGKTQRAVFYANSAGLYSTSLINESNAIEYYAVICCERGAGRFTAQGFAASGQGYHSNMATIGLYLKPQTNQMTFRFSADTLPVGSIVNIYG